MTERLMPFAFEEQLVRCRLDERGEPWFVAKDVALALGYQWKGISTIGHVPEEWRGVYSVQTPSGTQPMLTLSEQGLYFFVARSDKPRALPFQKWLAGEVLPSLRRTGRYALPEAGEEAPDLPVIPEMYALRPTMRQRLWQDALQTARLDNGGSAAAVLTEPAFCRTLNFPNTKRPCRSLCQRPRAGANRGVFAFLPSARLYGQRYILAEQRPVSVRTGGLFVAGERCSAFFCTL